MQIEEYLESLSFIRMGGSAQELQAAQMISQWMREYGYQPSMESFAIYSFEPDYGTFLPLEPAGESIRIRPVGLSADCDVEGEMFILDVPEPEWIDLEKISGKILFMSVVPLRKWLEVFEKSAVRAVISVVPDENENSVGKLPQSVAKDFGGKIAIGTMSFSNAIKLVQNGTKKGRVTLSHKKFTSTSHNVIAELDGTTDHIIMVTAHYDSTPCSPGAQDNAAGAVELIELGRRISNRKFRRKIRMLFCGSEEMGLLGSQFHASNHIHEIDKIDFLINLDIGGDPFTPIKGRLIGTQQMVDYLTGVVRQVGKAIKIEQDIYSSDCMPFSKFGVPSISIYRGGIDGKSHSPYDTVKRTCADALLDIVDVAKTIVSAIADAKLLPFKREISGEMKEKVQNYFDERF